MQKRFVLATVAAMSVGTLGLPLASWAETAPETSQNAVSDFGIGQDQQNSNPFSSANDGNAMSILNLIQRATSSGNAAIDAAELGEKLDDAQADFFKKREQSLQQQQPVQVTPQVPEIMPSN